MLLLLPENGSWEPYIQTKIMEEISLGSYLVKSQDKVNTQVPPNFGNTKNTIVIMGVI